MALSRGDALSISEVRLQRQSVVVLISESIDCAKNMSAYRPNCLFQTVMGFGGHPSKSR